MKTQQYVFTDYGEIVYVPNREIEDKYFDDKGRFCTLTNIDSGYDFHWAKILFQSCSLRLCIDYAIKTVTDNPKLLKKFIHNLDGTTYTVEYYKLLLKSRLLDYITEAIYESQRTNC